MGAHFQVDFERVEVVESAIAELAEGVIEDNLPCYTEFSLFEVLLQIVISIKALLSNDTFAIVEAYITE